MAYSFTRRIAGVDPQRAQDINDLQAAIENVGNVDLPGHADDVASGAALGHVKVGAGLSIDAGGVLSASAGASALNDLTDVTITAPTSGQGLTYNGTEWVNAAVPIPAVEASHEIGAAGEPAFQNGWVNDNPAVSETAGFYKDPFGRVHLKGMIKNGTVGDGTAYAAFTLPTGYRPALRKFFAPWNANTAPRVDIYPTGEVVVVAATGTVSLDGISWRV